MKEKETLHISQSRGEGEGKGRRGMKYNDLWLCISL